MELEEPSEEAGWAMGRAGSSCEMLKVAACTGKSEWPSSKPLILAKKKIIKSL